MFISQEKKNEKKMIIYDMQYSKKIKSGFLCTKIACVYILERVSYIYV